ncbi:MAG TPA: pyridoxal phosphate-dependent aminotransferase [Bacillota bacterium]|jgi:alanine-synthesizing transaminase|nr:pyridoxal phosphate-dependent aminotransferase [Bacillota bacterium]HOL09296.1 pyridoxal phosphate-dependent aminotransferase [Bacillota bacterium]HPO98543.1 pyridoxal phosphate-dependent aminotransferase [Bacillota bacterium]
MRVFKKSTKLENVCYDIRGPVMETAVRMEEEGHKIIKLNTGNPAPFGFEVPPEILEDMHNNLARAHGYSDSRGIRSARETIIQKAESKGITGVDLNDIYIGNGVSELIMIAMQGLLDNGDEVLIPAPDYPLWTAAVNLSGGKPVHYLCDEQSDWCPDIDDLKRKITPKTKGIVVINPNNPTGANYPLEILQQIVDLAVANNMIVFADEIYDQIVYDGEKHISIASLSDETLFVTMNGLSKSHRVAGYRSGWMILSGKKEIAADYIEGLTLLASMRLCGNVPAQYAITAALTGHQSIEDLIKPGGRLYQQREYSWKRIVEIPGLSCVKPKAALYLFPKVDVKKFNIKDDEQFMLDLLVQEKVLLVQGTGFNWHQPDHFRFVFLPNMNDLQDAFDRINRFLGSYQQKEERSFFYN